MNYPTNWNTSFPAMWAKDADCWEYAVFDRTSPQMKQVGKTVRHIRRFDSQVVFNSFDLVVMCRQFKEYKPPTPKKEQRKEMHIVRTETYDREGNLADLTVETRMVYWNSKGPHIKTRSKGSPRITDEENMTIIYRPVLEKRYRNDVEPRWHVRAITPEEFRAENGNTNS